MKKVTTLLLDFIEMTFISTAIFIIVYLLVGQLLEISGTSMEPNFHDKEQIVAEKITIKFSEPKRGEVVVFREPLGPERLLIKRVIGLPLEVIKVENGSIYINGNKLEESYLPKEALTLAGSSLEEGQEYQIGANSYILMGDNRDHSNDSRNFGSVYIDQIIGRAILVYYPAQSIRIISGR